MILFVNWWIELGTTQQIFWSLAIVASILLFILLFVSLFDWEGDEESTAKHRKKRIRPTEPKAVLTAFTLFGWMGVLAAYFTDNLQLILIFSLIAGLFGALLPWILAPLFRYPSFDADQALDSTGRVLQSIPPHRNGFGKVHLNMRTAPYEMDAVTAGAELSAGASVRIVEVIDDRVLLVEALEEAPEARQGKDDPAAPGTGRGDEPPGKLEG